MSLTAMQAMVSTPFALSFANYSMNPRTCFWEKVGVKASKAAKRTAFLDLVSSETIRRLNVFSGVDVGKGCFRMLVTYDDGHRDEFRGGGGEADEGVAMAMEKVQDLGAVKSLEIVREVGVGKRVLDTRGGAGPSSSIQVTTIKVSNISLGASKRDIKEFFSFSGDIVYVEMMRFDD
ncbi:hypothetical protein PS2_018610 [Malus domestica]